MPYYFSCLWYTVSTNSCYQKGITNSVTTSKQWFLFLGASRLLAFWQLYHSLNWYASITFEGFPLLPTVKKAPNNSEVFCPWCHSHGHKKPEGGHSPPEPARVQTPWQRNRVFSLQLRTSTGHDYPGIAMDLPKAIVIHGSIDDSECMFSTKE